MHPVTVEQSQQQILLKNAELQLTLRPDLGGRIDQLIDRKTGREWLWHPEHYDSSASRSLSLGASFDDNWTGGWDEIFPNDGAGKFQGRDLVDHGELWSQKWEVVDTSEVSVSLSYQCKTVPVLVEKMIELDETQAQVTLAYRIQNQSYETIPFLLKQHAAIAIDEGNEILLPHCTIEPVTLDFSKIIGQAQQTRFPKAFAASGEEVDLRHTPPRSSKLQEFYYCFNLSEGRCGIRHQQSQSSLIMEFVTAEFPYVWVFQSYGGWNDLYVLVMEPCTTMPYDMEIASRNGTTATLKPKEVQYLNLTIRLER